MVFPMSDVPEAALTRSPRLAGLVRRYHTWPISREQTVAEHSWHVARLYLTLFGIDEMSGPVWEYILWHDAAEIVTGDLPFPVKVNNQDLKQACDRIEADALSKMQVILPQLTSEQKKRVKLCDILEMWEYGIEEFQRGNQFSIPVIKRCKDIAINMTMNWGKVASDLIPNYALNQKLGKYMNSYCELVGYKQ